MNAQVNELQVLEQNVIVAAFAKRGGTDELFEHIAQEVRSHVPDVTTKKGRDAIGSLAMKVSKSKTLIEKCGKELWFLNTFERLFRILGHRVVSRSVG